MKRRAPWTPSTSGFFENFNANLFGAEGRT